MTASSPLLSLPEIRAAGVPEPWAFGRRDWVRSGEVDSQRHVNKTVYLAWFETVRVAYLHALEPFPYPERQTVIKSLTAEFHQEWPSTRPISSRREHAVSGDPVSSKTMRILPGPNAPADRQSSF